MFSSDAARRRPYHLTAHRSKADADSRLCRRRMCVGRLNTTGSRTRGYSSFRASRPSDASTYLRKGENVWKTGTWIAGGFQASGYIMSVYKWRLEDANRQRRLFKRYSLNAHCSQFISQNLWSSVASVSSVCQSLSPTRSPLYVKYFYFCPQNAHWFQNEQKPLEIVQKQT